MELIAKELRSLSVATQSNWIRHIKVITQTKISIYAKDIIHGGGGILNSEPQFPINFLCLHDWLPYCIFKYADVHSVFQY